MYYLIFLLSSIMVLFQRKKTLFFVMLISILAIFRYGVGADYFNYLYLYQNLSDSFMGEILNPVGGQEVGFRLVGVFLKKIFDSYQIYSSIIILINLYFLNKTFKKYSLNPLLSFLTYYCFFYFVWSFSALRQGLVLTILSYQVINLGEKSPKKFLLLVLALSFIHKSALVYIFFYLVLKIKMNPKTLNKLSLIIFSISFLFSRIIEKYLMKIPRISFYINHQNFFNFQSIVRIFLLILGLIVYKKKYGREQINANKKIILIYVYSFLLYFILKPSETVAARLSIYGYFYITILFPIIIEFFKESSKKIVVVIILIIDMMMMNKELNTMKNQAVLKTKSYFIPYTNILNSQEYKFEKKIINSLKKEMK